MADLQIISMFNLTPMDVTWEERDDAGEIVRHNTILFLDFNREMVFDKNGQFENVKVIEQILKIINEQKSKTFKFFSDEEVTSIVEQQKKESSYAGTIKF